MTKYNGTDINEQNRQIAGRLAQIHLDAARVNPNVAVVPTIETSGKITGFNVQHTDEDTKTITHTPFKLKTAFEHGALSSMWIYPKDGNKPLILELPEHAKAFEKFIDLQGSEAAEPSADAKYLNAPTTRTPEPTAAERLAAFKNWSGGKHWTGTPGARKR